MLEAIKEREAQRRAVLSELETVRTAAPTAQPDADSAIQELRRRVRQWQFLLAEETAEARQRLRTLIRTRIVVTPNLEGHSALFEARGNFDELFARLINLPKAMASPTQDTGAVATNEAAGGTARIVSVLLPRAA